MTFCDIQFHQLSNGHRAGDQVWCGVIWTERTRVSKTQSGNNLLWQLCPGRMSKAGHMSKVEKWGPWSGLVLSSWISSRRTFVRAAGPGRGDSNAGSLEDPGFVDPEGELAFNKATVPPPGKNASPTRAPPLPGASLNSAESARTNQALNLGTFPLTQYGHPIIP